MRTLLHDLLLTAYDELRCIVRDQGVLTFAIIVPLLYPCLYAWMYNNECLHEVPAAVVDDSHSVQSRTFLRLIDAAPEVHLAAHCSTMAEARQLMQTGAVRGIVHVPASFGRDLWHGEQATVGLYCSMASMFYYKALMTAASFASLEANRDIQRAGYARGTTNRQEAVSLQSVRYHFEPMFNTQSGYGSFILPPVLMLILQQTLLIAIAMSMAGRREQGFVELNANGAATVCGRSLPYLCWYLLMGIYAFTCVLPWFRFPALGSYWPLVLFLLLFLCAAVSMAQLLAHLVRGREDAILLFVFMSVPLLFLSGVSWPVVAMPPFWHYTSWLVPSTFGMQGFIRLSSMGADLSDVAFECKGLMMQTVVYFTLASFAQRRKYRQTKNKQTLAASAEN